ncbi:PAS domain-containing protein [Amycolatopsis sp. FDAARGOS 1241]|nr:PAS domain-containing protein [Amycolatopsis sp. FDAARGOS 1241]
MQDDLDARVVAPAVREIYESMPVMLLGLGGAGHRVLAVNAGFRALASRERMVGRTLRELFPEVAGQNLFEMTDRVYETGVAQVARGRRVQIEREPGSGRLDELYVDFTMAALRAGRRHRRPEFLRARRDRARARTATCPARDRRGGAALRRSAGSHHRLAAAVAATRRARAAVGAHRRQLPARRRRGCRGRGLVRRHPARRGPGRARRG